VDGCLVDVLIVAPREHDSQALATLAMAARSVAVAFDFALGCGIDERPAIAGQVRDYGEKNRIGTLAVAAAVADAADFRLRNRGTCGAVWDLRCFAPAVTAGHHVDAGIRDAAVGIDRDLDSGVTAS